VLLDDASEVEQLRLPVVWVVTTGSGWSLGRHAFHHAFHHAYPVTYEKLH
jgi:hypothetical protein